MKTHSNSLSRIVTQRTSNLFTGKHPARLRDRATHSYKTTTASILEKAPYQPNIVHLSLLGRDHANHKLNGTHLSILGKNHGKNHAQQEVPATHLSILGRDRAQHNLNTAHLSILDKNHAQEEERFLQYDERTNLWLLQGRDPP